MAEVKDGKQKLGWLSALLFKTRKSARLKAGNKTADSQRASRSLGEMDHSISNTESKEPIADEHPSEQLETTDRSGPIHDSRHTTETDPKPYDPEIIAELEQRSERSFRDREQDEYLEADLALAKKIIGVDGTQPFEWHIAPPATFAGRFLDHYWSGITKCDLSEEATPSVESMKTPSMRERLVLRTVGRTERENARPFRETTLTPSRRLRLVAFVARSEEGRLKDIEFAKELARAFDRGLPACFDMLSVDTQARLAAEYLTDVFKLLHGVALVDPYHLQRCHLQVTSVLCSVNKSPAWPSLEKQSPQQRVATEIDNLLWDNLPRIMKQLSSSDANQVPLGYLCQALLSTWEEEGPFLANQPHEGHVNTLTSFQRILEALLNLSEAELGQKQTARDELLMQV